MIFIIALIFALRIFSFMAVLPVITAAAVSYQGYSLFLIGLAIGVYGLLQACLHIPMGYLSDRYGRRVVVLFGLGLMLLGGVVAGLTSSVYGLILGRAIQGSGAIGSVLNAWVADLTSEQSRTKSMAVIGMTIGLTFFLAIILGPVLLAKLTLAGMFWLSALLAVVAMFLTCLIPNSNTRVSGSLPGHIRRILSERSLLKLDYGIFAVHASYTALFLIIPNWVSSYVEHAWQLYLPVLALALLLSLPAMFFAEAKGRGRIILLLAAFGLFVAHLLLNIHGSIWVVALFIYFAAFTVLEAILPSMLSKLAPSGYKGTAMGVFACAQYLGIFIGGAVGGWLLHSFGANALLYFGGLLALVWLLLAVRVPVIERSS